MFALPETLEGLAAQICSTDESRFGDSGTSNSHMAPPGVTSKSTTGDKGKRCPGAEWLGLVERLLRNLDKSPDIQAGMGRPYLQYLGDKSSRYCCKSCSCDVAASSALVWEGVMGSRQPAVLLRETVNVEQCGAERRERLSTGRYTLIDISCRGCCSKLGWHYLAAASPDQKYKEGCSLVEIASLHVVPARPQELDGPATQHRIAVQC